MTWYSHFEDVLVPAISSPLFNNVCVSLAMVLYFKGAIEIACWIRYSHDHNHWKEEHHHHHNLHHPHHNASNTSYSRHFLHVVLSSLLIFWPYFDTNDWSWCLNTLVPITMFFRMIYKGAIIRDSNDLDVQNFSLSSSPNDLLFGPLLVSGTYVWLGLYQFMTVEAAIVAAVGLGDELAPLIGTKYGRHIFQMPLGNPKTMEGSVVGVFLGTVIGCYFYLYMMGIPVLPLRMILSYAAIAAVAEGTSPGNLDNVIIPLVVHFSLERVQTWLPS